MPIRTTAIALALAALLGLATMAQAGFEAIGPFGLESRDDGSFILSDGMGRRLFLAPQGVKPPPDFPPHRVVRIPIKSLATDSSQDTALLEALDSIDVVKGATGKPEDWVIPHIRKGLKSGSIVSLGKIFSMDLERLAKLKPDLLMTWNESIIPMMDSFGIPTLIINTATARDLDTQIRFAKFLAPLVNKQKLADQYIARVTSALENIKAISSSAKSKPKVIWGDVYSKRVLIEPGNSWAAQIVKAAGGDYLFSDVSGDT